MITGKEHEAFLSVTSGLPQLPDFSQNIRDLQTKEKHSLVVSHSISSDCKEEKRKFACAFALVLFSVNEAQEQAEY